MRGDEKKIDSEQIKPAEGWDKYLKKHKNNVRVAGLKKHEMPYISELFWHIVWYKFSLRPVQ